MTDLLAHRAGLPYVEQLTVDHVYEWNKITSLLAAQKPRWKPGSAHGYHAFSFGFLAGELIQRVDPQHRSYIQFVRDELDPEFYVEASCDQIEARVAPVSEKEVRKNMFEIIYISHFSFRSTQQVLTPLLIWIPSLRKPLQALELFRYNQLIVKIIFSININFIELCYQSLMASQILMYWHAFMLCSLEILMKMVKRKRVF